MLTEKALPMKRAYILLSVVSLITLLGFYITLNLNLSSYAPRTLKDTRLYLQAKTLARSSRELAKYLLYKAKERNKECLNSVGFNYPNPKDIVKIDYFYPIGICEDFKLKQTNPDANLSKDGLIIANISIALNPNKGVNEGIFINQKAFIYTREEFWGR